MLIDLKDIVVEGNVRVVGFETQIADLTRSMAAIGQITPITVREYGDKGHLVIAGHRRVEAAKKLGWERIEAYVVNGTGAPLALQIAENVARRDLTDYELAQGVLALQVETGMNQADIAEALGVDKKVVSAYQRVAKGSAGLDPVMANQLKWGDLERLGETHDMPAELRDTFVEEYEAAKKKAGHEDWYLVNDYISKVKVWRWSKKKENAALLKAMEDIGAVPMEGDEHHYSKRLFTPQLEAHRGQPCHGYRIVSDWQADDFVMYEYCLDPGSHKAAEVPELQQLAKEAAKQGKSTSTVAERARTKAKKERKIARKEAVKAFAEKPRMRDLTRAMIAVILYEFRQYKWTELGKTFGMEKESDQYHYDWDAYLQGFNAKDQVTQKLILGVGAMYVALDSSWSGGEAGALLKTLDEVFGIPEDGDETPGDSVTVEEEE